MPRRLAAIMFTDLEGFTSQTQKDEAGALQLLELQEDLVGPILATHRGRKIKSMGDGLLVEFPNALDAVECSVDLQRSVHEHNSQEGAQPLRLRVGIHLGDVQERGTDIFGDAVNIASRIEPIAEAGGICLSAQVYDQVHNKVPYHLEKLGPKTLKGVLEPVEVYKVALPWTSEEPVLKRSGPPRLAVLPLTNISPDPKDEYFADGLTEELITVLSQIKGLRVISRTSVSQYKGTTRSVTEIGAELGADSVLEGSVRKAGDQLRIAVQLIDTRQDEHRWAQTYDRKLENVFAIQAEVAERTAEALRLELLGADRAAIRRGPTTNLEAYALYLRGIATFQRTADEGWTRHGVEEAAQCFESAIAKDPALSPAYSHYANLLIAAQGEVYPRAEVLPRVRGLVTKALELDPTSADAHTARGNFALQIELDWKRAEEEFLRAAELNPSCMPAHAWYGILLHTLGRTDEAIRQFETATELDPLFQQLTYWRIIIRLESGRLDSAAAVALRALERSPGNRTLHVLLGQVYVCLERWGDARREAALAAGPIAGAASSSARAVLLAALGEPEEARQLVSDWENRRTPQFTRAGYIARVLVALGEHSRALDLLEQDSKEGERSLWIDYRHRVFDPIRGEPRFLAMLRNMKLPTT